MFSTNPKATIALTLGASMLVLQPPAGATYAPASADASATSTACATVTSYSLVSSSCFPKLGGTVSWSASDNPVMGLIGGGSWTGTYASALDTRSLPNYLGVQFGWSTQQSAPPAETGTLDSAWSGCVVTPRTYAALGSTTSGWTIDHDGVGSFLDAWDNGSPSDGPAPTATLLPAEMATPTPDQVLYCNGSSDGSVSGYANGVPFAQEYCIDRPDSAWYWSAKHSSSGTLATGLSDNWDFTCNYYTGNQGQRSMSGALTMKENACPRIRTGKGYSELLPETKTGLDSYYNALDAVGACYRFVVGFRSQAEQDRLYTNWHAIADLQGPTDQRTAAQINMQLQAKGFAQKYSGRNSDGTAKGGPARISRHTSAEAADISVGARPFGLAPFVSTPSLRKLITPYVRSIAHGAGLCGPPDSDPVHVELKYLTAGQSVPTCHFG